MTLSNCGLVTPLVNPLPYSSVYALHGVYMCSCINTLVIIGPSDFLKLSH